MDSVFFVFLRCSRINLGNVSCVLPQLMPVRKRCWSGSGRCDAKRNSLLIARQLDGYCIFFKACIRHIQCYICIVMVVAPAGGLCVGCRQQPTTTSKSRWIVCFFSRIFGTDDSPMDCMFCSAGWERPTDDSPMDCMFCSAGWGVPRWGAP